MLNRHEVQVRAHQPVKQHNGIRAPQPDADGRQLRLHADTVSLPLHHRHVSIRAYACEAGQPVTGLADPSGGHFDRLIPDDAGSPLLSQVDPYGGLGECTAGAARPASAALPRASRIDLEPVSSTQAGEVTILRFRVRK
jgi:hypothetical protein